MNCSGSLIATVSVRHDSTLYQKWGDWFAWINLTALVALLAFWFAKSKLQRRPLDEREIADALTQAKS
jgi:hypothetical protein